MHTSAFNWHQQYIPGNQLFKMTPMMKGFPFASLNLYKCNAAFILAIRIKPRYDPNTV